jgi:hypothetical protein
VAFVTRLDATSGIVGPYRVDADAVDDGVVQAVRLNYAVQGGTLTTLPMTHMGGDLYRAEIPAQSSGAQVAYFVDVTDEGGLSGQSRTYTFRVGENAGVPGCGFQFVSAKSPQTRVLFVLGNALVILGALQGARKVLAHRHHHHPVSSAKH